MRWSHFLSIVKGVVVGINHRRQYQYCNHVRQPGGPAANLDRIDWAAQLDVCCP